MTDSVLLPEIRPVLGLGTIVIDHQVVLKGLPAPDTKSEILSDRFQVGGPVPTALALLGRFGLSTSFIGKWSTDEWGMRIEEDLEKHGVDVGSAMVHPQFRTGFAHVWVESETGRRSIAAYRGSHEITADDLSGVAWEQFGGLHLDGWSTEAAIIAAGRMRKAGGQVFIDLGSPKDRLEELISRVDHVNCPRRLLTILYPGESVEKAASRFVAWGATSVTVTDGTEGAWFLTRDGYLHQPAFKVKAIDTNGAGDVFAGAVVFGTLHGWTPERCLRFAAAAAALKCLGLGNRGVLPTRERIESFIHERANA